MNCSHENARKILVQPSVAAVIVLTVNGRMLPWVACAWCVDCGAMLVSGFLGEAQWVQPLDMGVSQ